MGRSRLSRSSWNRHTRKLEAYRSERSLEVERKKSLLAIDGAPHLSDAPIVNSADIHARRELLAKALSVPRLIRRTNETASAVTEQTLHFLPGIGRHYEFDHDHVGLCQSSDVATAKPTLAEGIDEKILDAAEVVWFKRVERNERNANANEIVKLVIEGKAKRRIRKQVAEHKVEIHPLYRIIEPRLPTFGSPIIPVAKLVGPKIVQAAFAERDIRELLLFRGNLSLARARAIFVFLSACMDAGVETVADIVKASAITKLATSRRVSDLAHLSGLHSPLQNLGIYGFLARIRKTARVWPLAPGIKEWADHVKGQLKIELDPISRYAKWKTKRPWRIRERTEVAEFYPYAVSAPTDEMALVLAVHKAVPKHLPDELRADVCQELLVDILSGNLLVEQLNSEDFGRVMRDKLKHIRGKFTWSLDEPVSSGSDKYHGERLPTRGALLTNDIQHW
jgi:hypothetical protein